MPGGNRPTADQPRPSRDGRHRDSKDSRQGQKSSSSKNKPRTGETGTDQQLDDQQLDVDEVFGGNYRISNDPSGNDAQYPYNYRTSFDPAVDQQASGQYDHTRPQYETYTNPHSNKKDLSSRSKPPKGSSSGNKSSSTKPKETRQPPKAATTSQKTSGESYTQEYEDIEYPPVSQAGTTGLETSIAQCNLQDDSGYGAGGEQAQVVDDAGARGDLESAGYSGRGAVPGGVNLSSNPWEVKMNFRTRKDEWGKARGLIDTGNQVGPMILSEKLWALGYSIVDIDDSYMIEFRTMGGPVRTAGLIQLQYYTSSHGESVAMFHVLANSFVEDYDAYLTANNAVPGPGRAAPPTVSALSAWRRDLNPEERKAQMQLLSQQHKGAKQIRDKTQGGQTRPDNSRGGDGGGRSSTRREKGNTTSKKTSAAPKYGSHEQANQGQGYQGYETVIAGQGAYLPDYAAQYPQSTQGQVTYPATGYESGYYESPGYQQDGSYQQGGYPQVGYQQGGYEQEGYQQGGYEQEGYQQGGYQQGAYQQTGGESTQEEPASYGQSGSHQPAAYPQGAHPVPAYGYDDQTTGGSRGRSSHDDYPSQDQNKKSGGSGGSKKQSSNKSGRR